MPVGLSRDASSAVEGTGSDLGRSVGHLPTSDDDLGVRNRRKMYSCGVKETKGSTVSATNRRRKHLQLLVIVSAWS